MGSVLALPSEAFIIDERNEKEMFKPVDDSDSDGDDNNCFLDVLAAINPPLELVFVGSEEPFSREARDGAFQKGRKKGIIFEFMTVANASATFNILNGEDRSVAAVLIREGVL